MTNQPVIGICPAADYQEHLNPATELQIHGFFLCFGCPGSELFMLFQTELEQLQKRHHSE
jgi:hypothetical protein